MVSQKIVGIEIDDYQIKIVQAELDERSATITKLAIARFSSVSEASNTLSSLIKKFNFDIRRVVLFIPRSRFSTHYFSLPTKDINEIKEIAKYRAKSQLLYSEEEVLHSFRLLEIDAKGFSRIMLIVARKDLINNYLKPLVENKIEPAIITMNSLGLVNWYKIYFPQEKKDICLIDLDWKATNICIFNKGKFISSREINKGVELLVGQLDNSQDLITEIHRSITAYEKENIGPPVKSIMVTGATKGFEKLISGLHQVTGLETTSISPVEKMNFINSIKEEVFRDAKDISLAKIFGILSGLDNFDINFITEEMKKKKAKLSTYKTIAIYGFLFTWIFLSLGTIIGWEFYRNSSYLKKLDTHVRRLNERISLLKEKRKVVDITLSHLNRRGSFLNIFKEIAELTPEGVSLRRFDYSFKKGKVILDGTSNSPAKITKFMKNLQSSNLFTQVSQKYVKDAKGKGNIFQIEIKTTK